MAQVTICDRCGKSLDASSFRKFTFRKVILTGSLFYPVVNDDSNWDLCADCVLELIKFLNGEATETVIKE